MTISPHVTTLIRSRENGLIYCTDEDFQTMLLIGHKLLMHAAVMYKMLPDTKTADLVPVSGNLLQKQFYDLLPQEFSWTDVKDLANTLGMSVKTIECWISKLIQNNHIQRVSHGMYNKIS